MGLSVSARGVVYPLDSPVVMGIVNVTPDSFSDGGDFYDANEAISHAKRLVDEGADWLDIGAESTRPGAAPTSVAEELRRLLPVVEAAVKLSVPVSVDTRHTVVMREVLHFPIAMINDVNALQDPGATELCAQAGVAVCLMHMQGTPQTMQLAPHYEQASAEVFDFLRARALVCERAGIARNSIVLDPGFGFGKTLTHTQAIMGALPKLCAGPYPVLVGWSRKSLLGKLTDQTEPKARLAASLAAALACVQKNAKIIRVHDVRATVDALKVWRALA